MLHFILADGHKVPNKMHFLVKWVYVTFFAASTLSHLSLCIKVRTQGPHLRPKLSKLYLFHFDTRRNFSNLMQLRT